MFEEEDQSELENDEYFDNTNNSYSTNIETNSLTDDWPNWKLFQMKFQNTWNLKKNMNL